MQHENAFQMPDKEQFEDLVDKVNQIFQALLGNEISKDGGIVKRLVTAESEIQRIDARQDKHEAQLSKYKAWVYGAWAVIPIAVSMLVYVINFFLSHPSTTK